jgi:hypothetical protein
MQMTEYRLNQMTEKLALTSSLFHAKSNGINDAEMFNDICDATCNSYTKATH